MKNLFFLFSLLCFTQNVFGQFELKVNPALVPFGVVHINAEYGVTPEIGIELEQLVHSDNSVTWLSGKYYLNHKHGIDRWNVGLFMSIIDFEEVGMGFQAGYKVVSSRNLLFEIGVGLGRSFREQDYFFGNNLVAAYNFHFGYRFPGKSKLETP